MFVFFYSPDADVQNQQSLAYLQLEQQIFIMKHKWQDLAFPKIDPFWTKLGLLAEILKSKLPNSGVP